MIFTSRASGSGAFGSDDLSALHDKLVANPDGSYALTQPDQSRFVFGPAAGPGGRLLLTALFNPAGQRLTVTYAGGTASSRGTVTVTEPISGKALTLSYDAQDRLVGASEPLGRCLVLQYQGASPTAPSQIQLLTPAPAQTAVWTMTYAYEPAQATAGGYRLKSITDQDGRTLMSATYDAKDRVVSQEDGLLLFAEPRPRNQQRVQRELLL